MKINKRIVNIKKEIYKEPHAKENTLAVIKTFTQELNLKGMYFKNVYNHITF